MHLSFYQKIFVWLIKKYIYIFSQNRKINSPLPPTSTPTTTKQKDSNLVLNKKSKINKTALEKFHSRSLDFPFGRPHSAKMKGSRITVKAPHDTGDNSRPASWACSRTEKKHCSAAGHLSEENRLNISKPFNQWNKWTNETLPFSLKNSLTMENSPSNQSSVGIQVDPSKGANQASLTSQGQEDLKLEKIFSSGSNLPSRNQSRMGMTSPRSQHKVSNLHVHCKGSTVIVGHRNMCVRR